MFEEKTTKCFDVLSRQVIVYKTQHFQLNLYIIKTRFFVALQGASSFIFDLPAFPATLRSTHIDALAM